MPSATIESVQSIGTRLGRSQTHVLGQSLDIWLAEEYNVTRWEGKLVVGERCVMISELIAEAAHIALVNCFVRVG